jgi:hypothetical protein
MSCPLGELYLTHHQRQIKCGMDLRLAGVGWCGCCVWLHLIFWPINKDDLLVDLLLIRIEQILDSPDKLITSLTV